MSIFRNGTLAQTNVIRQGVKIIRKVLAENDLSKGVSTAELYELALRQPPPPGYTGDPRLKAGPGGIKGIPLPPQNDHPIRSKSFLKLSILPALEGSKEIRKEVTTKEITAPIPVRKKGKTKKRASLESAGASPENPVTVKAWVWRPCPKEPVQTSTEHGQSTSENAEILSHLNKRRQRSRKEKERHL